MRREDGAAAVELALVGGVLLLLASGLMPILQAVLAYNELSRAAAEGLRYAAHAAPNPVAGEDDCPAITRWPSQEQVRDHVRSSSGRDEAVVRVLDASGQERSPCRIRFDEDRRIVVTATVDQDLGILAAVANAASQVFGGSAAFPDQTIRLAATAAGLKE